MSPQESSGSNGPLRGDERGSDATRTISPAEAAVAAIGHYNLLQKIGEGGMGEVWLAEQREPVRRRVALKLIKAGMNTREVIARFESERQALALMDHPAICKVLEAGLTPQGTPYFVMEYVPGVPITTYCDNHRLSVRERLDLFIQVCQGVQHAHQKGIIHRDLKPSNILVAEVDGRGSPKIIDFGVAKALAQNLTADPVFTRVGTMIGTPEYMSPEQALSSGEDVDTRTDIYSLGVIFYEFLAGTTPLELRKITFEEFLRKLREDDPPKPSTRVRTQDPAGSIQIARNRKTEPVALSRQLRGDLDSIALKALEKERARRYESAADMSADIGRHLRNEVVLAAPPSVAYRARKFGRRHRVGLATVSVFILMLSGATAISIRQSLRANRAAAVAQAVDDFLQQDLLAQASTAKQLDTKSKPDPDLKVRTALDRAASRISGKFEGQPEVEAAVRDTIGRTYLDLGAYSEARAQLERALDLRRQTLGRKNPKTLDTANRLGRADQLLGQYPAAEALLNETLRMQREVLGPEHPETLSSANVLGLVYNDQGNYARAEPLFSGLLPSLRRVLGPEHPATLHTMNNLANVYLAQGKYPQAESAYSEALEIRRRVSGREHPDTLMVMSNLETVYQAEGKYAQAEALGRETLETARRSLGPRHAITIVCKSNLAFAYLSEAKYAEGESLLSEAIEEYRQVFGPDHPYTLTAIDSFRAECQLRGDFGRAETYAAQILAARRNSLGSENPDTITSAADLALAYVSQAKFERSEPLAREAYEFGRKHDPENWQTFRAESLLGAALAGQKKYAEGEPLLIEGYRGMLARKERIAVLDWRHLDRAREWLVKLYQDWGKPEKAEEWRRREP